MKKNRRTIAAAIIGLIVIAVTLLIFFTAVPERNTIQWVSLMFIILAELIAAVGFIIIDIYAHRSSGVMLRAGAISLFILYFIAAAGVSIGFLMGFGSSVKWLVTIQLTVMAVAAVIMVPLITSSNSVDEKNRSVLQSAVMLKQLEDSMMLLKNNVKNRPYAGQLEKVYEAIRYCDSSSYVPADDLIALRIHALEEALEKDSEDRDEKVKVLTDEILLLSKKRAAEVKGLKMGGI